MRRAVIAAVLALAAALACGRADAPGSRRVARGLVRRGDSIALRRSATRELRAPRLVRRPTVVVFWLAAGDSLDPDSAADAFDDLSYYTAQVAAHLKANGIDLVPTNADTIYVETPGHRRRAVVLDGLDFPYGYVLIDPGGPERILTGIYSDDDLQDEIDAYFDLPADSAGGVPGIVL